MSRGLIVGAVAVVFVAVGAVVWTQLGEMNTQGADPAAVVQETPPEAAPEATQEAAETVQDAVEATTDAAAEAANNAAATAQEAVDDAVESVTGAVEAAEEAASDAATNVTDAVSDAVPEASGLEGFLTADGFDADGILDALENSDLGILQKTGLSALVEEARNNPELVESVISQVKEALGL